MSVCNPHARSLLSNLDDQPEATRAAIEVDCWLHTDDFGSLGERDYCREQEGLEDMIIRGGENIHPREIEEVMFEKLFVADAAAVGVPT